MSTHRIGILTAVNAEERLKKATEMFVKQASISEVTKKIATAVDESLSKQQKEYFLRQQLAAIQRELQTLNGSPSANHKNGSTSDLDDDEQAEAEDLADLRRKIEAMEVGSEERKMGVREWRRLKRIPSGSVENGVIRSYVSCKITSTDLTATDFSLIVGMAQCYPMAWNCRSAPD